MVAYLTNASLTIVTRREVYVWLGVYNLFLTPAHNCIHYCIQDWNWEWGPALNTSVVGPVWPPRAEWFSPCVRCSREGETGRSDGG